jgi:2'-hydroxyisoflavone reductase
VWIPGGGENAGFHRRSHASSIKAGLTYRPLAVTAVDTLEWFYQQSPGRRATLRAGLKRDRETELLKLLKA